MKTPKDQILILTTDTEGRRNVRFLGAICSAVCLSKSLVGDMAANVKNWTVGGELKPYSAMMNDSIDIVLERLREKARDIGADAVYGMRFSTSSAAQGAVELIGYGTAVKYIDGGGESAV